MTLDIIYYALFVIGMVGAWAFGLLLLRGASAAAQQPSKDILGEPVFLVSGDNITDSNFAGRRLLDSAPQKLSDIHKLKLVLAQRFDALDAAFAESTAPDATLISADGTLELHREASGNTIRLRITRLDEVEPRPDDAFRIRAMRGELETLRANTMTAPYLVWRQDKRGDVVWVNQSYLDLASQVTPGEVSWPLPILFPALRDVVPSKTSERRRVSIPIPDTNDPAWFDCHIGRVGEDTLCTAFRADEAVKAEIRRVELTQTLTKTFADLSIGLAIFDSERQLILFNPALNDLTTLPIDFLSSRPSLVGFLDRLREYRMMPDPKDYATWRKDISEIEAAAADGTYADIWSLPDGQTYRVTGRPHPDGAVALLIEDISAEMSLTRRFRAEIELTQSVMDSVDDAIAVFSSSGKLMVTNRAYRRLWPGADESAPFSVSVAEATLQWHDGCVPTPVWGDFRDFAQSTRDRAEWTATVHLKDGRPLYCRFVPKMGGHTMAMFRASDDVMLPESLREVV